MLPNAVNVLPILSRTRRTTLPFHKEVNLTLSFGADKISTSRVREEPFPCVGGWEIYPFSFKMPIIFTTL